MDTSASENDEPGSDDEQLPQPLSIDVTANDPDEGPRLWLQSITTLLAQRSHETDPSPRVQFALDMMFIAACERLTRILNADVSEE